MLLSTNFLKDYIDLDDNISVHDLAESMTKVGNEYDSASNFINATNLVIGKVLECEMHPDSDHLHVCKVDVGDEILQIVCGAPNVRKDLKVIVALPGAKLPEKEIKKGVSKESKAEPGNHLLIHLFILMTYILVFENNRFVLRNECLHYHPTDEISHSANAEHYHIACRLAVETEECERFALLFCVCE